MRTVYPPRDRSLRRSRLNPVAYIARAGAQVVAGITVVNGLQPDDFALQNSVATLQLFRLRLPQLSHETNYSWCLANSETVERANAVNSAGILGFGLRRQTTMLVSARAGSQHWDRVVAEPAIGTTKSTEKIVFSSDELPANLDDRARFSLWQDLYTARFGSLAVSRPTDRPFSARFEFALFGSVGLGQFEGTVNQAGRTARAVAADASDGFCLIMNRGSSPMTAHKLGREESLVPRMATLFSDSEPGDLRGAAHNAWYALVMPRRPLIELIPGAEDMVAIALDPDQPAMRHLWRYLEMLNAPEPVGDDPLLTEHIGTTLLDLVGLALGAGRDAAEIARGRGLRSARRSEIIAEIRARFADPAFSPRDIALRLGLTPRYVQELLSESGRSFTERVLELRLQKARAMLASPRHDRLRASDVAYACGFNDISYFYRCFRRRFGASPLQYRADGSKG